MRARLYDADAGAIGGKDRPGQVVLETLRELALGACQPIPEFLLGDEMERGDEAASNPLEGLGATGDDVLVDGPHAHGLEPGSAELAREQRRAGEPRLVERPEGREVGREPQPIEVLPPERRQDETSVGVEHPGDLEEGTIPVDDVNHESHDGPLEGALPERQRLCSRLSKRESLAPEAGSRRSEHLRRGLDAPNPSAALRESSGDPTGAAADVENPPADEIALRDEEVEELEPVPVDRAKPVVARGEPAKAVVSAASRNVRPETPRSSRPHLRPLRGRLTFWSCDRRRRPAGSTRERRGPS